MQTSNLASNSVHSLGKDIYSSICFFQHTTTSLLHSRGDFGWYRLQREKGVFGARSLDGLRIWAVFQSFFPHHQHTVPARLACLNFISHHLGLHNHRYTYLASGLCGSGSASLLHA